MTHETRMEHTWSEPQTRISNTPGSWRGGRAARNQGSAVTAEMVELYWMALLRDVAFAELATHPEALAAASELHGYRDFLSPQGGAITPLNLFRGLTAGDLVGPFLSQLLLISGGLSGTQRHFSAVAHRDYLTNFQSWVAAQNGLPCEELEYDETARHLRSPRDLALCVRLDAPIELFENAAYLLLGPARAEQVLGVMGQAGALAIEAASVEKRPLHRHFRPEEWGGRLEVHRSGRAHYPIEETVFHSEAHRRVLEWYGTSLLPMAYPEGSPRPSQGAGPAAMAAACITVLKAFVDASAPFPGQTLVPSADGQTLVRYEGADADRLTVGGELEKLASNVALGRCMAGAGWRGDCVASFQAGEQVALRVLQEHSREAGSEAFRLRTLDGLQVEIADGRITWDNAAAA